MRSTGSAGSSLSARIRVVVILAALLIALPVVLSTRSSQTVASWTDTEVATGSLTAASVGPPRTGSCSAGFLQSATFSWAHPNTGLTRTSYHIVVTLNGSTVVNNAAVSMATTAYTIPTGVLSIGSGTFSVRAVAGTWESTAITGTFSVFGLLFLLDTACSVP
jgi:predicted ribosomally synthesized peptide with SipW-like signal peptide